MKDKCTKCEKKAYTASLCKKHYKEAFEKNRTGIEKRFKIQ